MIKFWRNRKKVTSEQEERVWDRIDSLYSKWLRRKNWMS